MVAIAGAEIGRFGRRTDGTGWRDWAGAAFARALARDLALAPAAAFRIDGETGGQR